MLFFYQKSSSVCKIIAYSDQFKKNTILKSGEEAQGKPPGLLGINKILTEIYMQKSMAVLEWIFKYILENRINHG